MKKPKAKRKDNRQLDSQLVHEHVRGLHEFLKFIMVYADEPANWPLSQQEQVAFVRQVLSKARELRQSEGYIKTAMMMILDAHNPPQQHNNKQK